MSDQPKPRKQDAAMPTTGDGDANIAAENAKRCLEHQQPKPTTGEWTRQSVVELLYNVNPGNHHQAIADAHNAAQENSYTNGYSAGAQAQHGEDEIVAQQLREQLDAELEKTRNTTGGDATCTAQPVTSLKGNAAPTVQSPRAATSPTTGEWTIHHPLLANLSHNQAGAISDAHNSALAVERDEWIVANRDLAIKVLELQNQLATAQAAIKDHDLCVEEGWWNCPMIKTDTGALDAVSASAITQLDQAYAKGAAAERERYAGLERSILDLSHPNFKMVADDARKPLVEQLDDEREKTRNIISERNELAVAVQEWKDAARHHVAVRVKLWSQLEAERKKSEHWRNLRQVVPDVATEQRIVELGYELETAKEQLAAERNIGWNEGREHERKCSEAAVAAEPEKVQTLVDALGAVRRKIRLHTETITSRVAAVTEIIDAALAKVREGVTPPT